MRRPQHTAMRATPSSQAPRAICTANPNSSLLRAIPAQNAGSAVCSTSMAVSTSAGYLCKHRGAPGWRWVLSVSYGAVAWEVPVTQGGLANKLPSALAVEGQMWEVMAQGQRPGKPRLPSELPSMREGREPERGTMQIWKVLANSGLQGVGFDSSSGTAHPLGPQSGCDPDLGEPGKTLRPTPASSSRDAELQNRTAHQGCRPRGVLPARVAPYYKRWCPNHEILIWASPFYIHGNPSSLSDWGSSAPVHIWSGQLACAQNLSLGPQRGTLSHDHPLLLFSTVVPGTRFSWDGRKNHLQGPFWRRTGYLGVIGWRPYTRILLWCR